MDDEPPAESVALADTPFIQDQESLQNPMGVLVTLAMVVVAAVLCGVAIFMSFWNGGPQGPPYVSADHLGDKVAELFAGKAARLGLPLTVVFSRPRPYLGFEILARSRFCLLRLNSDVHFVPITARSFIARHVWLIAGRRWRTTDA
jgi:hypothetical protein